MKDLPKHVDWDVRICFSIKWFETEEDALIYHSHVQDNDIRYVGGWYHDRRCGRDKGWDREVDGKMRYAVTC